MSMVALDGGNSSILTVESHNACLVFFGWLTAGGLDCLTADYWTKVQYTGSVIFDRDDSRLKPETKNVVDPDRTLTMLGAMVSHCLIGFVYGLE
ncbi:MAG: hypothetical protein ACXW6V_17705 [Candidatus Binatia bacterium]